MKNILEKRLNNPNSKPSNLKLIVSLNIKVNNLGVNKDLNTFGKRVTILVNYVMYEIKIINSFLGRYKIDMILNF